MGLDIIMKNIRVLSALLTIVFVLSLFACDREESINNNKKDFGAIESLETTELVINDKETNSAEHDAELSTNTNINVNANMDITVGFIFLHDVDRTYDKNFIDAARAVTLELGIPSDQVIMKFNVSESSECYDAACELVDEGCDVVFANSFGHESYMIQAAKKYPNVQFCTASGYMANTEGIANYKNAYAAIYEGRYLTGIAAGMKINEMIADGKITENEAKIGFVGAWPYSEVISSYTAFFLGAKSVCPSATMDVYHTYSWYDEAREFTAANTLIEKGCVLISQYSDSLGAPSACEYACVPNIAYNGSTYDACPETFIVSSKINWESYYIYIIDCVANGKSISTDWCGGIKEGSVVISNINFDVAAKGTAEAIQTAKDKMIAGSIHVFDTKTFTVNQKKINEYYADVNYDPSFSPDTQVIRNGVFYESTYRSVPYFDILIDGIQVLN